MKTIKLFLFLNFLFILVNGQTKPYVYDAVHNAFYQIDGSDTLIFETPPYKGKAKFTANRIPPVFIGDIKKIIKDNVRYPQFAKNNNMEDHVDTYFRIDENGMPDHITIMSISTDIFNEEAKRLVHLMRWKWDENEKNKFASMSLRIEFQLPAK